MGHSDESASEERHCHIEYCANVTNLLVLGSLALLAEGQSNKSTIRAHDASTAIFHPQILATS